MMLLFAADSATKTTSSGGSVPAWGAALLGVFIGYLVWYFVVRLGGEHYTTDGLVAVVGVIAGGVVVQFMQDNSLSARDHWWYPIGLVIGWGLFVAFNLVNWVVKKISSDGSGPPPFPALRALLPGKTDEG